MKNGFGLAFLRTGIGGAWWLPLFFLLATAAAASKAGDFTYATNADNTLTIIGYTGLGGAVVIPSTIDGKAVTGIGDWAFYQCSGMTSVMIPDSVTNNGDFAFASCHRLTSLIIGSGVTSIGWRAFQDCASLTSVNIGSGVTSIKGGAFYFCPSLTSITIPKGVTNIENWAFEDCLNLTGVYFEGNAPVLFQRVYGDWFKGDQYATLYYLPGTTGWGPTIGGRPAVLWNRNAIIKANGEEGGITINHSDTVSVTVSMNADIYDSVDVDGWVLARAGTSWYYLNSSCQWTRFDGMLADCHPVYQGPLANLESGTVLNTNLSPGSYKFWFAIDSPMDGILNLGGYILLDSVSVTVQ